MHPYHKKLCRTNGNTRGLLLFLKKECLLICIIIALYLSYPWCRNYWSALFTISFTVFCNEHKLLSPFQCGFRSNHSTEFAAVAFSDYVRRGMDQGLLSTGAVFIDLRKAFDSVDHDLLISKLQSYGLSTLN